MVRKTVLILTALIVAIATASAQSVDPGKPLDATTVLDKHVAAIGGREALTRHRSVNIKGTVEMIGTGIKGLTEIYAKTPNKFYSVTYIGGFGTLRQGFDGTTGWASDPLTGTRELDGSELALVRRLAKFSSDAEWRSVWKTVELAGTRQLGEATAYVVLLTPHEGSVVTNLYDTTTYHLLQTEQIVSTRGATVPIVTKYLDYRAYDGVMLATVTLQELPTGAMRTSYTAVDFDVAIDDSIFVVPPKQ